MAFIHDHTDTAKNLGKWYPITYDDERKVQVLLRIRRMAREERRRIEKPFLRSLKQRRGGKTLGVPNSKMEEFGTECAIWMWTDIRNGYVVPEDEQSAKFYGEEMSNGSIKKGQEIKLDGKLNSEIKLRLMGQDNAIGVFITEKGILLDEEGMEEAEVEAAVEETATENLSSG